MLKLRIAILTHSTNPRGGVVHALELGDALVRLGHEAVVHAPDARGKGFFRPTLCETVTIPAGVAGNVTDLVARRRGEYSRYFHEKSNEKFDVFHAQDSISANALADLKSSRVISRFVRTVHHIDEFDDPKLTALQIRGIAAADRHFTVSRHWQKHLRDEFGLASEVVGNGVDIARFTPAPDAGDAPLRARLRLGGGPVLLSIGGIEERKNSFRILQAFQAFRRAHQTAQWVIAGGASLLDHSEYRQRFDAARSASGMPEDAIIITGPLPQAEMPALYRCADMLVFPSVREGFGLAVLEAMASSVPVVTANIAPFTEYLKHRDAAWCDPYDAMSIGRAMRHAIAPPVRDELRENGRRVAAEHDWRHTASAHLETYASIRERTHA